MQCLEETDSKNEFILIEYKYDNRIPGSTEKKSFYPKRKKLIFSVTLKLYCL